MFDKYLQRLDDCLGDGDRGIAVERSRKMLDLITRISDNLNELHIYTELIPLDQDYFLDHLRDKVYLDVQFFSWASRNFAKVDATLRQSYQPVLEDYDELEELNLREYFEDEVL